MNLRIGGNRGKDVVGLLDQVAVGGVNDVGAGEAVVHPLAFLAKTFADGAGEGHDVVACLFLYLLDARNGERGLGIQLLDVLGGHHAQFAPGLGREKLDLEIGVKFILFGPYSPHFGA